MDFKVIHIDETYSTNGWLREFATDANIVVVAEYQTAGKGWSRLTSTFRLNPSNNCGRNVRLT